MRCPHEPTDPREFLPVMLEDGTVIGHAIVVPGIAVEMHVDQENKPDPEGSVLLAYEDHVLFVTDPETVRLLQEGKAAS